jgi:hypothetical protein
MHAAHGRQQAAVDDDELAGAARDRAGVLDLAHGLHREVAREAADSSRARAVS